MADTTQQTQARRVKRIQVSIPAAAGTAVTLYSLVQSGLTEKDYSVVIGGMVHAVASDYVVGDSASSLPLTIAAAGNGAFGYTEPAVNFLESTFVKASSGGAITAVVAVYLSGDGRA